MKIDTHQHYWRYQAQDFPWISEGMPALRRDCMPADIAPGLRAAGVDGVVAVQARSCEQETDDLLALAHAHPHIVGVVGWTDLTAPNVADALDRHAGQTLLKGYRHILQDEPQLSALLANPDFGRGIQALQHRGLVYDVLVFDHQMSSAVQFCARHNAYWLVLDHLGKPAIGDWQASKVVRSRWLATMRDLASMPHVVCKLSGLVTETPWAPQNGVSHSVSPEHNKAILECFDRALELFGPQRILFGSDWPVCQLAASYESVHGQAKRWANTRLTSLEQEAFWSGNATRIYGLDTRTLQR